jgi:hypothetical protein
MLKKAVQQGRRRIETGRRYRPHSVGPFARRRWILANGKAPLVFPTSENFNRYVEDFDEPRTLLAGFFSILLKERYDFAL